MYCLIVVIMDILKEKELVQVLGGGYWWLDSTGVWHYIPDDEESDDEVFWR